MTCNWVVKLFSDFPQTMAGSLLCSVENSKTIRKMKKKYIMDKKEFQKAIIYCYIPMYCVVMQ